MLYCAMMRMNISEEERPLTRNSSKCIVPVRRERVGAVNDLLWNVSAGDETVGQFNRRQHFPSMRNQWETHGGISPSLNDVPDISVKKSFWWNDNGITLKRHEASAPISIVEPIKRQIINARENSNLCAPGIRKEMKSGALSYENDGNETLRHRVCKWSINDKWQTGNSDRRNSTTREKSYSIFLNVSPAFIVMADREASRALLPIYIMRKYLTRGHLFWASSAVMKWYFARKPIACEKLQA